MKIGIYAVGRLKAGPEKELASRYLDRLTKAGPQCGLEFTRSVELNESRAGNADTRKREEAQELSRQIPDGALIVVLDERGKAFDSAEVAKFVGDAADNGQRDMACVIGGADGIDPELRDRARLVLNLGKLTWPHQLVRILIAEQLYRAVTILTGHPYHRV